MSGRRQHRRPRVALPDVESLAPAQERLGWRGLFTGRPFRRLVLLRIAAQWGDGMFQAALGSAVLFNPERQADPVAVAAGLAVLLLPYSAVGPFAGALLDRWDRRRVLLAANLLRGILVLVVAGMLVTGVAGPALYLGALSVAGVSRFVLAGLSAALPDVVERQHLVEANVVAATVGVASTALGAACAIGLRGLVGAGDGGSSLVTVLAVVGSVGAAALAARFRPGQLGPLPDGGRRAGADPPQRTLVSVAHGLVDGARAVVAVPSVAASFAALAAHRLAFGISTLLSLLMFRYAFGHQGLLRSGIAGVGEAIVVATIGVAVAAVITPWLVHRFGRANAVRIGLCVAAAGQFGLAAVTTLPTVLMAAFVLPTAGQVVKLCTDSAVQSEIPDDRRGRVFALYDAVFNVTFVVAVSLAALFSPPDGRSTMLLVLAAIAYLVGLLAHEWQLRRLGRDVRVGDDGTRSDAVLDRPLP